MNLYIVRHGETADVDSPDNPLNETGEEQIRLFGERMKSVRLDMIYSSPLVRAVRTASAAAVWQENREIRVFSDLAERGTTAGYPFKSEEELKKIWKYAVFPEGISPMKGETESDTVQRAERMISYIRSHHGDGENVMLVAHGTFNNYLIHAAMGIKPVENFNFSQDNTGITLVRFIREDNGIIRRKIAFANCTRHFEEDNIW